MSTNCFIACKQPSGGYKGIYCHYDGYLNGVGKTLVHHYSDPAKVNELINLGDLSVLGDEIGTQHNFGAYDHTQCTAYKRDGGETDTDAQFISSYKKLVALYEEQPNYEFIYVYDPANTTWYWVDNNNKLQPVSDLLDE